MLNFQNLHHGLSSFIHDVKDEDVKLLASKAVLDFLILYFHNFFKASEFNLKNEASAMRLYSNLLISHFPPGLRKKYFSRCYRLIICVISFLPFFGSVRTESTQKRDQNFIDKYPHCPSSRLEIIDHKLCVGVCVGVTF